jgi:hypothetical protein
MTVEPLELRSAVSKTSKKTKSIIIITAIAFLSIIVGFSVVITLSTSFSSSYSSTKNAICTAKVLELAQKGYVRETGGYYGAIFECTRMHGLSSVYGEASM